MGIQNQVFDQWIIIKFCRVATLEERARLNQHPSYKVRPSQIGDAWIRGQQKHSALGTT